MGEGSHEYGGGQVERAAGDQWTVEGSGGGGGDLGSGGGEHAESGLEQGSGAAGEVRWTGVECWKGWACIDTEHLGIGVMMGI